jgi:MarR family transcriptional regulator, organic hydroperoxide resistance regulator
VPGRRRRCEAWDLLQTLFEATRARIPAVAAELELPPAQCQVLRRLPPRRPITMGELARSLACDASNVTGLVDRLESRGLVERRASRQDRRVKVIALTTRGGHVRARLVARLSMPPDPISRLSEADRERLSAILRKVIG